MPIESSGATSPKNELLMFSSEDGGIIVDARLGNIRLYLAAFILFTLSGIVSRVYDSFQEETPVYLSGGVILLLICLFIATGLYLFILFDRSKTITRITHAVRNAILRFPSVGWIMFILPILSYGVYRLSGWQQSLLPDLPQIWIFGCLSLIGAFFLSTTRKTDPAAGLFITLSVYGLGLLIIYYLPDITNYPLALGWSETSRYYYASLFLSKTVYGEWFPLPALHGSQGVLQAFPFLIPAMPIWIHRLWQVMLWLGLSFGAGLALAKRLQIKNRSLILIVSAWFCLYVFQGPVYYHFYIIFIIVLLGVNHEKRFLSLFFVALASIWAGISRVNWFPLAGMLAAALYILEVPKEKTGFWKYWWWPVGAVLLGLGGAVLSQYLYVRVSGNPLSYFTTSFESPLLRYRLFPNQPFGMGIINMMLIACVPLMLAILWAVLPRLKAWNFLRLLSLFLFLLILLVGGLVVSSKIGGGNNLHNLDAYMVLLALIMVYFVFGRFSMDKAVPEKPVHLPVFLLILVFMVPLAFITTNLRPLSELDFDQAWQDIAVIQALIDEHTSEDGKVLFIQHRHLVAFNIIEGVVLVPEHEKVFLMEMAMANNEDYLSDFWASLENHEYDLIISEPYSRAILSYRIPFGEENNIWVELISKPLGKYYTETYSNPDNMIGVFLPRE